MVRELRAVHSACAPIDWRSWTRVSTSRMRGTFSRCTGSSQSSEAATIGSAAFLLPEGRMRPDSL
jgi:hypothetical protein